jgi:hypothetical protein
MNQHELVIYSATDGNVKVSVRLQDNDVWLSQLRMAELFQTTTQNITQHIKNIYSEGELAENATCKDFLQVVNRGFKGEVQDSIKHYNLEMIIAVGYREAILEKLERHPKET